MVGETKICRELSPCETHEMSLARTSIDKSYEFTSLPLSLPTFPRRIHLIPLAEHCTIRLHAKLCKLVDPHRLLRASLFNYIFRVSRNIFIIAILVSTTLTESICNGTNKWRIIRIEFSFECLGGEELSGSGEKWIRGNVSREEERACCFIINVIEE